MTNAVEDVIEVQQLLAKYAVSITKGDMESLLEVFTPDGTYSAFGEVYRLDEFPALVESAPKGLFMVSTPLLDLQEDEGTGVQNLCFVEHATHDMRIGYYNDTYRKTADGWRLRTRSMTFIRRNGEHNSGRPHSHARR